jgi:hypothetical protein
MALTNTEKQNRFKLKQRRLGRKELRNQYLTPAEAEQVMKLINALKNKRPPEE